MKALRAVFSVVAILAVLIPAADAAQEAVVCDAEALAAFKQLPPPPFRCDDSGQYCSTDQAMRWDEPECKEAVGAYEKTLRNLLSAQWWSVPASALEACRVHGKPGKLTREEDESLSLGLGPQVQGTDRTRMLVLEDPCEGSAGLSNIFLAVRTSNSIALTVLYYAFNQGGQEAPFTLDVAAGTSGTFALFTSQGHDMQSAYATTTAYRIDPDSGYASLYPLFVTAQGPSTQLGQSEPISSDLNFKDTAIVRGGRFAKRFLRYTDNLCQPDDDKCHPVTTDSFTRNGGAFVESGYQQKRSAYLRKLASQRECVKRRFNPKKGNADCITDLDCPIYNDLSWLNLKAGNVGQARNYAEGALLNCRSNFKEFQAAQYNYRQSSAAR